MHIQFKAIGLEFVAEADWDDFSECLEFEKLTCDGRDAGFLMDSSQLQDDIYDAALKAYEEACATERAEFIFEQRMAA